MSVVPKEVITSANKLADLYADGKQGYGAFDIAVIAIMEERERAAKIVETVWSPDQEVLDAIEYAVRLVRGEAS